MKGFFDTSVLVSAFYEDHPRHEVSFEALVRSEPQNGFTATHCLAEIYATVTGMPGRFRAGPDDAMLFLESLRQRLTLISLDEATYIAALERASSAGVSGGTIYDALLVQCAIQANADIIYTWNIKHFSRFGTDIRVSTP